MNSRNTVVRSLHDVGAAGWSWITPVLTGALVVLGAQQGEQQRPGQRIRSWRKSVA